MSDQLATLLLKIGQEYRAAEQCLAEIQAEMSETEAAGMYPAIPTERWKDNRYLYMYFNDRPPDLSLDAKGRLYIGADPARIAEARRLVANRIEWEALNRIATYLQGYLRLRQEGVKHEYDLAVLWREGVLRLEPGAAKQLELDIANHVRASGPKNKGRYL